MYFYDGEDGECPIPQVYENKKPELVIYDHEGNPLTPKKIALGFDLTVEE